MKKLTVLGILLLVILLPAVVSATGETNLLANGDFSDGLSAWTDRSSGIGNYSLQVVYDGEIASDVLEYRRWNSGADGGITSIYQDVNLDVQECSEIYLEADVKVISNSLGNSGWWSDVYGGLGEFPAHIFVYYDDADGESWAWSHGFLPNVDSFNRTNYDVVTRNEWYHYKSPNLVNVHTAQTKPHNEPINSPTPSVITWVRFGGNGHDYKGRYDNLQLYCIRKPRRLKQDSIELLQSIDTDNPWMNTLLDQIAFNIEKSLSAGYWTDEQRLNASKGAENGKHVFLYEAIASLLCSSGEEEYPELEPVCDQVQHNLVTADKQLAGTALDDARNTGLQNPGNQPCYDLMLELADTAFVEAEALAEETPVISIIYYMQSWMFSQRGIEFAQSPRDICPLDS